MSSEIQKQKSQNANELQKLYDTYRAQRAKLQESQTKALEEAQSSGQSKIKQQNEVNQATVNHIREKGDLEAEKVRAQSESKVAYEKAQSQKRLEAQARLLENQRAQHQKQNIELQQLLKTQHQTHEVKKNEVKSAQAEDLKNITDESSQRIEMERKQNEAAYLALKHKGLSNYQEELARQTKQLEELKSKTQTLSESERNQQHEITEKLKSQQREEVAHLHKQTDQELAGQKEIQSKRIRLLEESQTKEEIEVKAQHKKALEEARRLFEEQKLRNDQIYKAELSQQKDDFETIFAKNQKLHTEVLEKSQTRLREEIYDQKLRTVKKAGKHLGKEDPFYSMQRLNGSLKETPSHYILEAALNEDEKDQVRVHVNKGKVVVSGKRSFEDKVQSDGHRIETNSFQTFREELPLSNPVAENMVESSWSDGVLRVKIPKV